jgi:hypothetical protein
MLNQASQLLRPLSAAIQPIRHQPCGVHLASVSWTPQGFDDIYLCDLLQLSYTELAKQPAEWVDRMRLWHEQKAKAEEVRQKQAQRLRRQRRQ